MHQNGAYINKVNVSKLQKVEEYLKNTQKNWCIAGPHDDHSLALFVVNVPSSSASVVTPSSGHVDTERIEKSVVIRFSKIARRHEH